MLRHTTQRLLKINQMLPVKKTTIAHNTDRQQSILIILDYLGEDEGLVNGRTHRDCVVAGTEGEVC